MNLHKRAEFVRAMERIVRGVNDEFIANLWLSFGVADGDINGTESDEDLEFYVENDEEFADLMDLFLKIISTARESGGLYVDGVVSKEMED